MKHIFVVLFSKFDCDIIDRRGLHLDIRGLYFQELILGLDKFDKFRAVNFYTSQFRVLQGIFLPDFQHFQGALFCHHRCLWRHQNFCILKLGSDKKYLCRMLSSKATFLHLYFKLVL